MNSRGIAGVILTGGTNQRMNGENKAFLKIGDKTCLERITHCLSAYVSPLLINYNQQNSRYSELALPLIKDNRTALLGPLAGIESAMQYIAGSPKQYQVNYLLVAPCDTPFLPNSLPDQFHQTMHDKNVDIVFAQSNTRLHFAISLWRISLLDDITAYLDQGNRSIKGFIKQKKAIPINFSCEPFDPFFNINTPEELEIALAYESKS